MYENREEWSVKLEEKKAERCVKSDPKLAA